MSRLDIEAIIGNAQPVGNTYSGGVYSIDEIRITFREGIRLPRGDYVFIRDPDDGLPIIYQIAYPYWYKPSFDFEESLIVAGSPIRDEHRMRYRAKAVLVGKVDRYGSVISPRVPVPPLTEVYKCPRELVRLVTEPLDEWKIRIGENPETGLPVYIALEPLVRQSLLITGAQGTGKTTALLTLIVRAASSEIPLHVLVPDWTGEYGSLAFASELEGQVKLISWEHFVKRYASENPSLVMSLMRSDPRMRSDAVNKLVSQTVLECRNRRLLPTKSNLERLVEEVATTRTHASTIALAKAVIVENVPERYLEGIREDIVDLVQTYRVVIVDFSISKEMPDEFDFKAKVGSYLAEKIWRRATTDRRFGCIVVSDEAHRICPEHGSVDRIWLKLATEGGRNGCPLWLVARRLSLVSKSITTESQQNIVCFNLEDVDRKRVEEDIGTTFAGMVGGTLAQGEAMVRSAMGFRVPGQVIHVKFDEVVKPASASTSARIRFEGMRQVSNILRNVGQPA